MTRKSKVLTGLILSTVLATGVYASCDMKQKHGMMNNQKSGKFMNKSSHRKSKMPILSVVKQLNLSDSQRTQIKDIMINQRKEKQTLNDAFTKSSFDKEKFVKIMSEKRENMLKSKANMIEKVYAVLDSKQKEQFKTLIELKSQKMMKRFN